MHRVPTAENSLDCDDLPLRAHRENGHAIKHVPFFISLAVRGQSHILRSVCVGAFDRVVLAPDRVPGLGFRCLIDVIVQYCLLIKHPCPFFIPDLSGAALTAGAPLSFQAFRRMK
jgi:hypothetical protein